jgi:hypothetical protein
VLFRALSEDSSGSGGALSPLLPQQAQSETPCSTIPFLCVNTRRWVTGRINRAHARSCEEADLASLRWICVAEQLCTDAALVLDASTRVAAAAGSCLIDVHLHCVVDLAEGRIHTVLMLGVARKLTLRASGGSVSLTSYAQTQRSC